MASASDPGVYMASTLVSSANLAAASNLGTNMDPTPVSSVNIAPGPASTVKRTTPGLKTVGFIGFNDLVKAILKGIARTNYIVPIEDRPFPKAQYLASIQPGASTRESVQDGFLGDLAKRDVSLQLMQGDNVRLAMQSDLVILATPPDTVKTILTELRMADALSGKIIVSLAAGVTISQMKEALFSENGSQSLLQRPSACCIIRARPTTAACVAKSITSIALPDDPPQLKEAMNLVNSFFLSVGTINHFPESQIDGAAVVFGATPAFMALFCEAIIEGAVAGGLSRAPAERMTVRALAGMSDILSMPLKPYSVREKLCANPGNTTEGVMALEKAGVRGKISAAMWDCMSAALSPD